jgi:hypothetical protein
MSDRVKYELTERDIPTTSARKKKNKKKKKTTRPRTYTL